MSCQEKNGLESAVFSATGEENLGVHVNSSQESLRCGGGSIGSILVADDSSVNQRLVKEILEKEQYGVSLASTGREVLECLLMRPYDLILMDVQMPDMDGVQATEAIRSGIVSGINPHMPVVALTTGGLSGSRQRCFDAGMNDYLLKPVAAATLLSVVRKYVFRRVAEPPPVIDTARALGRLGDKELLNLVCTAFLRDVPVLLDLLESSISEGDFKSAERHAHSLKGAAANIGGDKLRSLSLAMETAAEGQEKGDLVRLFPKARAEVGFVMKALQYRDV